MIALFIFGFIGLIILTGIILIHVYYWREDELEEEREAKEKMRGNGDCINCPKHPCV